MDIKLIVTWSYGEACVIFGVKPKSINSVLVQTRDKHYFRCHWPTA